jgi:NADPH:quinone reductase-like Zn-dependent oxidoreductase
LQALAENIIGITSASFWPLGGEPAQEREYAIENGQVLIPRVRTDDKFNSWVASTRADGKQTYVTKHRDDKRPIKLWPETPGLLNTLRFIDDEVALRPLAPNELELKPMAYGINFKDVFVALGQQPPGAIMAGETAGIVTAVGCDMERLYRVGDRVAGLVAEPYASHPRLQGLNSHTLPDSMSFIDGASAVAIFSTAWYCLVTVANLQKGESVLIHSGSGGVGQAAIQIAQYLGAVIYTTVGSAIKRDLLINEYGIPTTNIFASGSTTFKDAILHRTKGRGVDVVLNSISGEQLKASVECTGEFGRFVEIGKSDILNRSLLNMASFDRGISVTAVDFSLISKSRQHVIHDTLGVVFDLFDRGVLRAVSPITTFSMDKVEEAFRLISGRKHLGKLVLLTDENTMVRATVPAPGPLKLSGGATYVVVGGLGDLGRRVCLLLARAGAGHVVTISRTVPADQELAPFRREIESYGAILHTRRGDVTDSSSLLGIASSCRDEVPTVKGVIHSGLALCVSQDSDVYQYIC